ncbi:hypothetical protein B5F76_07705 [Desulfovibrio sp. An276]|nr:hypothetical protein B5F76_07705 [Desulfovibrio sp. An276]
MEINYFSFDACVQDRGQPNLVSELLRDIVYQVANRFVYSNTSYLKEFYKWVSADRYNQDRIESFVDMIPAGFKLFIQYRNYNENRDETVEVTEENFETVTRMNGLNHVQYAILRSTSGVILELKVSHNYMYIELNDRTNKIWAISDQSTEDLVKNLCDNTIYYALDRVTSRGERILEI